MNSYYHRSQQLWRLLMRPHARQAHFELGIAAFEKSDHQALQSHLTALAMLPDAGPQSPEYQGLTWRQSWLKEDFAAALDLAKRLTAEHSDDPDLWTELAQIYTHLERWPDALDAQTKAVTLNPDDVELWFELGILAENLERDSLRQKCFHRVWSLEHAAGPNESSGWLPDAQIHRVIEHVLSRLPKAIQTALDQLEIIISDYPDEWVITEDKADPRVITLLDATTDEGASPHQPTLRLYIYRTNLARRSEQESSEEVLEEALFGELSFFLGLDMADLYAAGAS